MAKDLETLDALALMRQRFHLAEEAEHDNRVRAQEAIRFYYGEQWLDEIEHQRKQDGRPCFTLNKLPAIAKQILNEARTNRPAIQINPVGEGADEDTAEALQGLCRHVEHNGEGADIAIDTAFEYMVLGGFGSWRILHDYLPKSFDQDLFIERIPNPMAVYWDPAATKLDKSDARFCFITHDLSVDAYKEEFPKSELSGLNDFSGVGDQAPGWLHKDGCRVVEYYYAESEKVELVKLDDGRVVYEDEIPKDARIAKDEDGQPIMRPDVRRVVYVAKSNGVEWLEKPSKLPTDDIPVVSIFGEQLVINGETRIKGFVQDLEEAQRLFNFNSSAIAETMALGTKAQWLATADQIEPYKEIWRQANSRNIAVLPWRAVGEAPPPQKIVTEPPIQAMSAARLQSVDDLRSISGVYDATAQPETEESGKAILARRRQTSQGNAHFTGNLARGIKRTAKILLKYFRVIYDTPRVMRIIGSDMQPKTVMVHAGNSENVPFLLPDNIKGVFDLRAGDYDVTVSVGPSYETKRQEAVEMLLTLCEANPAIVPIVGDLIVNEMDFSGKKAIVERLQKALPPQLQDQQNPMDPNQLAAHNSQLMQQNQALMQQVQHITQILQTKQVEAQGRLQVESLKLQSAEVRANASLEQERLKAQASILTHAADQSFNAVHDHAMSQRAHLQDLAAATHQSVLSAISGQQSAPQPKADS